jgi:hypothetical protein
MSLRKDLFYLIVLSAALSLITTTVMHNTIPYKVISDADRYIDSISHGTESRLGVQLLLPLTWGSPADFITKTNFLFILAIGYLVYSSTKSWKITALTLLGFSVSLMLYFSLLAQMIVIAIGLWLWTKVEPFEDKHTIRNHIIYILAGVFALFTHKYGGMLVLVIWLIKLLWYIINKDEFIWFKPDLNVWARRLAILSYICAGILLFIVFFPSPERVSFFYYFLLPISLGPFDMIFWLGLFGLILWMLFKCENNTKEILLVAFCFFAATINYLFFSQLEIDFWRILLFGELIALIKIGQSEIKGDLLKYAPWVLIAIGVQRLIIGLMV